MAYTIDVDQFYDEVKDCVYKGEHYQVRNNGAIIRLTPVGKKPRRNDGKWTFGETITNGYACFCGERVHRIVATAFLGEAPSKQHVVDHLDTNRQNNRPENLRWLTRLENILLNPITRQKIEYLCGSVESFLEDPSQLKGYEHEDANFSWMRAVSPDEARNTMENWHKLMSQPRPLTIDNSEPISDWIFGQRGNKPIIEPSHSVEKEITQTIQPEPPQEKGKVIVQKEAISKKMFLEEILKVCDKKGWTYQKYFKTEDWRSDVLITTEDSRFSFSAFSSKQQGEKIIETTMSDGINAFGFLLKQGRKPIHDAFSRILEVIQHDNELYVSVMEKNMTIGEFIEAIVLGKLVVEESYLATAMNVAFIPYKCYFCEREHYIYVVHSLVDAENQIVHSGYNQDSQFNYSQFSPAVMNPVKRYLSEHPEKNILMGEIKPRMSRTVGEEYMSFGCPYCDGIVGSWYLHHIEIDWMYSIEAKDCEVIPLQEPVEIKIRHWKMLQ